MEILNVDTSLSFLQNEKLLQVCVGENELLLLFGGEITATIEVPITHTQSGKSLTKLRIFERINVP